ncbi:MAG: RHS repeat-associated core domain-containing protein [Chloroflexota bacterium]|nr:RHS repeat-associated core domain-containing protein [Chloroflexota bacterium]
MGKTVSGVAKPFVWDVAQGLPLLMKEGTTSYIYGPGGMVLAQISSTGVPLYYHRDQLGSVRMLTDAVGAVKATYNYDVYGKLKSKTGTVVNPFGYAGEYTDAESGMQYLRARYYDPSTGQFITRDPLQDVTRQPYSYATNSPVNSTDPSGKIAPLAAAAVVGGVMLRGAAAGAIIGAGTEAAVQLVTKGQVDDWGEVGKAAAWGTVTGALTAGVAPAIGAAGRAIGRYSPGAMGLYGPMIGASVEGGRNWVASGILGAAGSVIQQNRSECGASFGETFADVYVGTIGESWLGPAVDALVPGRPAPGMW